MLHRSIWNVWTVKKWDFLHRMTMKGMRTCRLPIGSLTLYICVGLWEMSWKLFFQPAEIYAIICQNETEYSSFYRGDTICYIKLCSTSNSLERHSCGAGRKQAVSVFVLFFVFSSFSHTLSLSLYFWIFSQTVSAICVDINIIHIHDSAKPVRVIDLAD